MTLYNHTNNTYKFVFIDDSYRIVLEPVPNLEHDYINASYIDVRFQTIIETF